MGRILMVIGIAVCTCLLVLWFLSPRLLTPGVSPTTAASQSSFPNPGSAESSSTSGTSGLTGGNAGVQLPPIEAATAPGNNALPNLVPLQTPEQKAVDDYEAQRAAFYAFLKDKCGALVVEGRPALDDRSILSLYCTRNDDHIVNDILTQIIDPYAYAYGFRHVRFYLPNPANSVEHYHLGAEANAESPNNWKAFQK